MCKGGRAFVFRFRKVLSSQTQGTPFLCSKGGQPGPNHHLSSHYSLPLLLPLEQNIQPSPFLCQPVLLGASHLRNSCFISPPIFLLLFSLTFETSRWPMFKWGALSMGKGEEQKPSGHQEEMARSQHPLDFCQHPSSPQFQKKPNHRCNGDLKVRI